MFKVHKKLFFVLALISMILGILALAFVVFDMIKYFPIVLDKDEAEIESIQNIIRLISLIFMLLVVAFYLRPKMKLLKVMTKLKDQYRYDFFELILSDSSKRKIDITEVTLKENSGHLEFTPKKKAETLVFENLTVNEAVFLTLDLLREFSYAMYAKVEMVKGKPSRKLSTDAMIDSFTVRYELNNNITKERIYIQNGKYINIKKGLL